MSNLKSKIESILFLAAKPLMLKRLAQLVEVEPEVVAKTLEEIQATWNKPDSGLRLLQQGKEYQLVTSPDNSKLVAQYLQEEVTGELTRPSLEALTIIAYRGPVTKPELEQIRGVNCSLILRNLLIRGLIQEEVDTKTKMIKYSVTLDFLKFLGLQNMSELPEYERLHGDQVLQQITKSENVTN